LAREKDELVGLDKDIVTTVINITEEYDKEDKLERDEHRSLWTKLENYFHGKQRIFYNSVAKDWRSLDNTETARHYDKIINVYRGHAESIIAALSIKPPTAIFYPADADVEADITTAKACTKIKSNIERFNQAQQLMIKALMILFNQGVCAAYIYNKKSHQYGSYATPDYSKDGRAIYTTLLNCSECGSNIDEITFEREKGKVSDEEYTCPVCGFHGTPEKHEFEEYVPEIIGTTVSPKSKTCIEVFSPLYVYMPFYCRRQEHLPYLRMRFEQHYANLKNLYPVLRKRGFTSRVDQENSEERGITVGVSSENLSTVDCWWIRPWAYDILDDREKERKKLKENYPDGIYAVLIDGELVEIHNESLDDHWSVTHNPLDNYIHSDPLGKGLAPIQDLENEILDLQIETFEHAIPETFARSDVLDFKKYSKSRAAPGMIYPVMAPAENQSIGSAFHSVKTATLSEEADLMMQRLDAKAQFVSAAFPSIYGGPAISGSKTASEYTQSRSMALQRLSLPWNTIKYWWADVMAKAVPLYIKAMRETGEDEKMVEKTKTGFINTWIRQSDIEGTIGVVEADADENLPMTPAQLKDTIVQLMTMKDEFISDALTHPQNAPLVTKALGAPDFYIPGSDDRNKQYGEFGDLLQGIPVEVSPLVDKHEVEAEVCRTFLVSPTGLMLKKSNPQGVKMIEEHMGQHIDAMTQNAPAAGIPPNKALLPEQPPEELGNKVMPFPGRMNSPEPVNSEGMPNVNLR
jgi:predicted RNA-binding Zn-ribbon protein involved in translation (DUF1610 family)